MLMIKQFGGYRVSGVFKFQFSIHPIYFCLVVGIVVGKCVQFNIKVNLNNDLGYFYGGGGGTLLLSFSKSLNIHHNSQHLLDFIAQ